MCFRNILLALLLSAGSVTTPALSAAPEGQIQGEIQPESRAEQRAELQSGARLYRTHCAACHGHDGKGGAGVPLSMPAFLDSVPDAYLEKTIRLGRPGRVMPSFKDLPDAQISAIVAHLRAWSGKPAPLVHETPIKGDAVAGRKLYTQHCAACHGADAEGAPGTGVTFSRPRDQAIMAPGLANAGFLAAANDAMLKRTLMLGREGTPMQSFLKRGLDERGIDNIVTYLRSLQTRVSPPAPMVDAPLLSARSSYSLKDTVDNVKRAALGMNYRIIREQYLDQGMAAEGAEDRQTVIVYFCNFKTLNQSLAIDPRVGMFLPCRVTIREDRDGVIVSSINPLHLSRLFNNYELDALCRELHAVYESIIEEATL